MNNGCNSQESGKITVTPGTLCPWLSPSLTLHKWR